MDKKKKFLLIVLLILAVVGIIDSFIVFEKISGNINAPCVIGQGCDVVLYSYYSKFLGISLSWWGLGFYSVAAILASLNFIYNRRIFLKIYSLQIFLGFLFSLYLLYVQIFDIGTLCTYCLISLSDILASVGLLMFFRKKLME